MVTRLSIDFNSEEALVKFANWLNEVGMDVFRKSDYDDGGAIISSFEVPTGNEEEFVTEDAFIST